MSVRVLLASSSPSRLAILRGAGITPEVMVSDLDEAALEAAHPEAGVAELVLLLAEAKAEAVLSRLHAAAPAALCPQAALGAAGTEPADLLLVAADSVLDLDGQPVGKPGTAERTRQVWQAMGGRSAVLHSGQTVIHLRARGSDSGTGGARWVEQGRRTAGSAAVIHTARPTPAELEAYIATTEPFAVAGALTIDGYGGPFVTGIEGDHHTVLGLGLPLLREMVTELGLFFPDLWDVRNGTATT